MDAIQRHSPDLPDAEMTGYDDAPITVERVVRGQAIIEELRSRTPMPYPDGGKGPSIVAKGLAKVREVTDADFGAYQKLKQNPDYKPVRAFSRGQAERLGLMSPDRTSQLDRLLEQAPAADQHETALESGQALPLPMLGDPGEKHDLPPFVAKRTFEVAAGSSVPLKELPAAMPDLTVESLQGYRDLADGLESGSKQK